MWAARGTMFRCNEACSFARGGDRPGGYPGTSELVPLDLDERDRADLVAFLEALDGPGPDAALLTDPR
jgi:hypothetical protein